MRSSVASRNIVLAAVLSGGFFGDRLTVVFDLVEIVDSGSGISRGSVYDFGIRFIVLVDERVEIVDSGRGTRRAEIVDWFSYLLLLWLLLLLTWDFVRRELLSD